MNDRQILDSLEADQSQPFGAGKEAGAQGSVEWLYDRVGYVTASRFKDVRDFTKAGKPGAKRTSYLWEVVIERLTGQPVDHWTSTAMQHGTENEPMARMAYEAATGAMVDETGFHKHPTLAFVGGSPDGLVGDDGGFEAKCPFNSANHLQCFLSGMPEDHTAQVQGLIWLHGRKWWDFVSYDPRLQPPLQTFIERQERDEDYIAKLEAEIIKFLAEVAELHGRLVSATEARQEG